MNKYLKGINKYILYSILAASLVSFLTLALIFGGVFEGLDQQIEEALIEDTNNQQDIEIADEGPVDEEQLEDIEEVQSNTYPSDIEKKDKVELEEKNNSISTPVVDEKKGNELKPITAKEYIVEDNDTLFLIAQRSGVSVDAIKNYNNLNGELIMVGQVLVLTMDGSQKPSNQSPTRGANRDDDLYWLSRIIHAEAQGEPYIGKVAVGNVVLNRVKSSDFPNSIHGVVFDKQHGYTQFSPVIDGTIYNTPNQESIDAAKAALNGERPIGDALYFLNPRKATNFWIVQNRKFYMTIGDHDFYH